MEHTENESWWGFYSMYFGFEPQSAVVNEKDSLSNFVNS